MNNCKAFLGDFSKRQSTASGAFDEIAFCTMDSWRNNLMYTSETNENAAETYEENKCM